MLYCILVQGSAYRQQNHQDFRHDTSQYLAVPVSSFGETVLCPLTAADDCVVSERLSICFVKISHELGNN